jgi:hypothetical protein
MSNIQTLITFEENFGREDVPNALIKLYTYQLDSSGFEQYANGFGIMIDDKGGLKSWSEDETFLNRLYPFAQANGSGSFYCIWDDGSGRKLREMPIIVFGDEGGIHVIAENCEELLKILSFDVEVSVDHDSAYYYKSDEYYSESDDRTAFLAYIKADYNIEPITDAQPIIDKAQALHKEKFDAWCKNYFEL